MVDDVLSLRGRRRWEPLLDSPSLREVMGSILDSLPAGVVVLDARDLTIVQCNSVYASWLASCPRPLQGLRLTEAIPTVMASGVLDILEESVRTGRSQHLRGYEYAGGGRPGPALSGGVTVWNWDVLPILGDGGDVAHLVCVGVDVTEQAVVREELEQRDGTAQDLLADVSRHAAESASTADFLGRVSERVAGLLGARRAAFLALDETGALRVEPDAFGFLPDQLRLLRDIPCDPGGHDLAGAVVHHDRPFVGPAAELPGLREVGGAPPHALAMVAWQVGGRPIGTLVAAAPIAGHFATSSLRILRVASLSAGLVWLNRQSERRLAAVHEAETAVVREHMRREVELERAKSNFLNLASHELRGPVTVLSGYLSMFEEGSIEGITGRAREAVPIMRSKVSQINALINDMLEAARMEEGDFALCPEPVDLGELADEAVALVGAEASDRHAIRLDRGPEPVVVRADRSRLRAILVNLLDNAVKYSPQGGEVRCMVGDEGGRATVVVSDQGLGIAAEQMARLFTRFGRIVTSESSHIPGTGLGLYLAREFARLHSGDITVVSEPGQGTTFTLVLPKGGGTRLSAGSARGRRGGAGKLRPLGKP